MCYFTKMYATMNPETEQKDFQNQFRNNKKMNFLRTAILRIFSLIFNVLGMALIVCINNESVWGYLYM